MFYFRQKKLVEYIKKMNTKCNISLSEDAKYWEENRVFDIEDLDNYLAREHEINLMKDTRR